MKATTKREQRPSTLPPGQADRVLDRLLLLEQVIPKDEVLQVLRDTGCLDSRRCTLTFEVTCWLVLAMGLLTEMSLRQVFKAARRLLPGDWDPDRSSLCKARRRLGPKMHPGCRSRFFGGHSKQRSGLAVRPSARWRPWRLQATPSVSRYPQAEIISTSRE